MMYRQIFKSGIITLIMCIMASAAIAQVDRSKGGILIKAEETKEAKESSLSLKSKAGLSKTNNGFTLNSKRNTENFGKKATVDMSPKNKNKFIDPRYDYQPNWLKKDRPVKDGFGGDQYLGDVKTNAKFIEVLCRDHEFVDGDRVQISLDGRIIEPNVYLQGGYTGFIIDVTPGFNKIEFKALNMGTSGPNTAELKVIDDKGQVISSKEWNLQTGAKATIIVVK